MTCSRCGKVNAEGGVFCTSCAARLGQPTSQSSVLPVIPASKTSGLAIAAFVFSLLGFCTMGIAWIPAIVLGVMALKQAKRNPGDYDKVLAIIALAIPACILPFAVLAALLFPVFASSR